MRVSRLLYSLYFGVALSLLSLSFTGCGEKCKNKHCGGSIDSQTKKEKASSCGMAKNPEGFVECTHVNDDCIGYDGASCSCNLKAGNTCQCTM
jgi:hypothetical protein